MAARPDHLPTAPKDQASSPTSAEGYRPFGATSGPDRQWDRALLAAELAQAINVLQDNRSAEQVQAVAGPLGYQVSPLLQGNGFGAMGTKENEVFLVFRGTNDPLDWLANLNFGPRRVPELGQVHRGIYREFLDLLPQIESRLATLPQAPRRFTVIGHSLGGAVALFTALRMMEQFPEAEVELITFAQPPVGNEAFVDSVGQELSASYLRFVMPGDPIPYLPPQYKHGGQLYRFCPGDPRRCDVILDQDRLASSPMAQNAEDEARKSPLLKALRRAYYSPFRFIPVVNWLLKRSVKAVDAHDMVTYQQRMQSVLELNEAG